MNLSRLTRASLVIALGVAWTAPAEAGIFGIFGGHRKTTAYYQPACSTCAPVAVRAAPIAVTAAAPACPAPQPIAVANTCMQQRCYLAPVTRMETRSTVEPVTSYQTSYYLEPVTTMRTSAYYNPCICGYQNVTTPVTSYVRKAVVKPVTTMVTRNYQVPVTEYQRRCVNEPVTRVQYYYPAGTAAPAQAAVVPAQAAPVGTPAVGAMYWRPVAPPARTPQAQGRPPERGNVIDRRYVRPNGADDRTKLVERFFRDGKLIKQTEEYFEPGMVPAPKAPKSEKKNSAYRPQLLRPVPAGQLRAARG